jgi:hypothetical protein
VAHADRHDAVSHSYFAAGALNIGLTKVGACRVDFLALFRLVAVRDLSAASPSLGRGPLSDIHSLGDIAALAANNPYGLAPEVRDGTESFDIDSAQTSQLGQLFFDFQGRTHRQSDCRCCKGYRERPCNLSHMMDLLGANASV